MSSTQETRRSKAFLSTSFNIEKKSWYCLTKSGTIDKYGCLWLNSFANVVRSQIFDYMLKRKYCPRIKTLFDSTVLLYCTAVLLYCRTALPYYSTTVLYYCTTVLQQVRARLADSCRPESSAMSRLVKMGSSSMFSVRSKGRNSNSYIHCSWQFYVLIRNMLVARWYEDDKYWNQFLPVEDFVWCFLRRLWR